MCFEAKKTLEKKSGFLNFILFFVSIAEITHYFTPVTTTASSERENTTTDLLNAVLETKRAVRG